MTYNINYWQSVKSNLRKDRIITSWQAYVVKNCPNNSHSYNYLENSPKCAAYKLYKELLLKRKNKTRENFI